MIVQLTLEGRKFCQKCRGVWTIMSNEDVQIKFQLRLAISKNKPVKCSDSIIVDASSHSGKFWSDELEKHLFCWYKDQSVDVMQIRLLDYSGILKEVGRTENACKQTLQALLRNGIYITEREDLIAKLTAILPDKNTLMKMRLAQLCMTNGIPRKDID